MYNQPILRDPDQRGFLIALIIAMLILAFIYSRVFGEVNYPDNLWMGLIAEDTSGDYQTYLAIASVVRNRLDRGLSHGLVALKRQNLEHFVEQNCAYVLKTKGLDLTKLATKAIQEVWDGKNLACGATHYEHTGVYSIPKWAAKMKVVKVMFEGTKKEITFWK